MSELKTPQQIYDLIQSGWQDAATLKSFKISQNFNWGEVFIHATRAELLKVPRAYLNNALKQAQTMEKVRAVFGKPIIVHSWYRSPQRNIDVKGGSKSQHLYANATDFHVLGMESDEENLAVQKKLDKLPFMQKCGMEWTNGDWTHVDSRGYGGRF